MVDELRKEFRLKTFGYLSTALGLVAGLAWNDAIAALIDRVFQMGKDTITAKFIYAIVVTLAVIFFLKYSEKIFMDSSKKNDK